MLTQRFNEWHEAETAKQAAAAAERAAAAPLELAARELLDLPIQPTLLGSGWTTHADRLVFGCLAHGGNVTLDIDELERVAR